MIVIEGDNNEQLSSAAPLVCSSLCFMSLPKIEYNIDDVKKLKQWAFFIIEIRKIFSLFNIPTLRFYEASSLGVH